MRSLRSLMVAMLVLAVCAAGALAAEKPLSFYAGAGFSKMMNDGAPGGSVGFIGGLIYKMQGPFALGGETGFLMLGKNSVSYSGFLGMGDYSLESKLSCIPITGQAYYMIPTQGSTAPYLTGGIGFYNSRAKVTASGSYAGYGASSSDTASNTDFGINLGGGAKMGKGGGKVQFGADARFHIIMSDGDSGKLLALMARAYF
jgi:hypothetical protein